MASIRIGVLVDFKVGEKGNRVMFDALNLAFSEALEDGLIDRPVELVVREAEGIPRGGSVSGVLKAWRELKEEGVIGIYGPWISENALAMRTYIEKEGQVPSLSMTGTDRWYGEWCFNINNGSLPEDPYLITNYLVCQNIKTVAVAYDKSAIGEEYRRFFHEAARSDGVEIVGEAGLRMADTDVLPAAERLKKSGAEAVVYLGFGLSVLHLNRAFAAITWDPIRVMTTAFMTAPFTPQGYAAIQGWIGLDQYDETNEVGQAVIDRFEERYGYRPSNFWSLINYDFGHVIAHALSKSYPLSPEGFKAGLERVKMLPAANGGARGLLSFGPYMRRAWLSPDFILMRQVDPAALDVDPILSGPGTIFKHRYTPQIRGRSMKPVS